MYLTLAVLWTLNILMVNCFDIFGLNDGYSGVVEQIESKVIEDRIDTADIKERWMIQKLNHFNESDTRKWRMRFYENVKFWKRNGPVYLFLYGEASASPNFLATGILYELAKETGGVMYLTEHRYYGKSQPVKRSNFNVENMMYLTAEQAMADNAKLLRAIKRNPLHKTAKVVIVGGSYAGNLAAWMRLVYPDLVDAAISSSGPVLAKRDFYEYLEIVAKDYKKFGTFNCLDKIEKQFLRYDSLFQTAEGINQLRAEEKICEETDMTKPENRQLFFLTKVNDFMVKAQYGTTTDIKNHCLLLNEPHFMLTESDIKYYWNDDETCYDYDFDKMVKEYREAKNDGILCWTYQTCNEFGYFQSTSSEDQPFSKNIPVEFYEQFCTSLFGADFDKNKVIKGVKKINENYGGKAPKVTEVVFVNGEMDPWSSLGITTNSTVDAPVIYIPKSSHCSDLFSDEEDDAEELKKARVLIKGHIKKWIGAGDNIQNNLA